MTDRIIYVRRIKNGAFDANDVARIVSVCGPVGQ